MFKYDLMQVVKFQAFDFVSQGFIIERKLRETTKKVEISYIVKSASGCYDVSEISLDSIQGKGLGDKINDKYIPPPPVMPEGPECRRIIENGKVPEETHVVTNGRYK